jgi:dethiobiotin synthetase
MTDRPRTLRRLGITGTDTGIGKTVISCALAARARQLGVSVAAMKPVESGIEARPLPGTATISDAERVQAASGSGDALSLIRPYVLTEPLAPAVAAQRAGVVLDLAVLDAARAQLERGRERLLVEGAGGLLVPLTWDLSFAGLFARWQCDLVLVAGNRLGVLNHVLLTVQAAERAGLPIAAIVLSSLTEQGTSVADATNFEALQQLLPNHRLHQFPWIARLDDYEALAAAAHTAGLDSLLTT